MWQIITKATLLFNGLATFVGAAFSRDILQQHRAAVVYRGWKPLPQGKGRIFALKVSLQCYRCFVSGSTQQPAAGAVSCNADPRHMKS